MPTYDVACTICGMEDSISLKIADVEAWDQAATCPDCKASGINFRRVMIQAPAGHRSAKSNSAAKDDMRHKSLKRINSDQTAEAREIVAKGTFEGF